MKADALAVRIVPSLYVPSVDKLVQQLDSGIDRLSALAAQLDPNGQVTRRQVSDIASQCAGVERLARRIGEVLEREEAPG